MSSGHMSSVRVLRSAQRSGPSLSAIRARGKKDPSLHKGLLVRIPRRVTSSPGSEQAIAPSVVIPESPTPTNSISSYPPLSSIPYDSVTEHQAPSSPPISLPEHPTHSSPQIAIEMELAGGESRPPSSPYPHALLVEPSISDE